MPKKQSMEPEVPGPVGSYGAMRTPAGFHPGLEALRGFASVMVLLFHCTLCWSVLASGDAGATFASDSLLIPLSGDAPVVLFFVLSGFVLAGALSRLGHATPSSMTVYAVRRFFRIVPAAWAALFVTIAAIAVCSRWPRYFEGTDFWITDYLSSSNLGNLGGSLLFVDDLINPMYWSLHVELVGSALMPLLYAAIQRNKPGLGAVPGPVLLVLLPLVLLPFVPYTCGPLTYLLNTFLFSFAFGTLAFRIATNHPRLSGRLFSFPVGISAAALLVLVHNVIGPLSVFGPILGYTERLSPILGEGPNIDLYVQHLFEAGAAALLVGSVVMNPELWSILKHPASRFVGRISYSLYVVHFSIIVASIVLLRTTVGATLTAHPWLAPFLTVGLVVPVSIMAASLLYVAIEKPGMTLGRRVAGMLGNTASTAEHRLPG